MYFIWCILLVKIWNVRKCMVPITYKKTLMLYPTYEGKSISKLQIQVATYVFELSAGNCQC